MIDDIKKLTLQEIKELYCDYLLSQNLSKNTIHTCCTDAFYLYRNDNTIDFWELLKSPNFEELAYNHLYLTLSKHSNGKIESNINGYMTSIRKFRNFLYSELVDINKLEKNNEAIKKVKLINNYSNIPTPSIEEVEKYLKNWNGLDNYSLQEMALNKLFLELAPLNTNISDILIKSATLNDFYSTNIFSILPVAKHILSLNIDSRLKEGDETLVDEIKNIVINNKTIQLYSFATKYCSHHNPNDFPIYDSFVDKVLRYFRDKDGFLEFKNIDLKEYKKFKAIIIKFQEFYGLHKYSFKEIDKFLWQFGKEYFPKNYKSK